MAQLSKMQQKIYDTSNFKADEFIQYLFGIVKNDEYMRFTQEKVKKRFDWVFLNCGKTIYVCDYNNETIEPIVLPKNAENFLNTESEYLRYCHEWVDGMALDT